MPEPASKRRSIERLSGWRLNAFFVSAALNAGLLISLTFMPLFMDASRLFVATALVLASHCVCLIAIAGFRFPVSIKLSLGFAHATACMWALASVDALPWVWLGRFEVKTIYLIPLTTLMVTSGGIAVAVMTGYHRSKRFSVRDVLLMVTVFAILFPLVVQLVPRSYFTEALAPTNLTSAFVLAACSGITSFVISNLFLNFVPTGEKGMSPLMMTIGWFLFMAMVNWTVCQLSFLIAVWMMASLLPVCGIRNSPNEKAQSMVSAD